MVYGFNRGAGSRGGMGFGFRGSSPPWPYVGRGRGGLPRCAYFLSGAAGTAPAWPQPQSQPSPQMGREQELSYLKSQASALKGQLEQIDARIKDLEAS